MLIFPATVGWSWHLHTTRVRCKGCQGFKGPLPSAFLDKCFKNCRKGNSASCKKQKNKKSEYRAIKTKKSGIKKISYPQIFITHFVSIEYLLVNDFLTTRGKISTILFISILPGTLSPPFALKIKMVLKLKFL